MENKPERHIIAVSAIIPARRERVYSLLANYNEGHPRILPKQFSNLVVEQGGIGAGTVIRFEMSLLGRKQTFQAAITEPEPGRVLVETYLENGAVTTFTIPRTCSVRFAAITFTLSVRSFQVPATPGT